VLAYGIFTSEVRPLVPGAASEGHSLLYRCMLWLIKGPIPEGHDIFLTPTAFAGWVGLLVTMINLVPAGQLDGGHVAYALFGSEQRRYSRYVRRALVLFGLALSLGKALHAWWNDAAPERVEIALFAGANWLLWGLILKLMSRLSGEEHPPTEASSLSPARRAVACFTLALFPLLFMPTWLTIS
jgi:hypothetical protein